jgi:hypothetical protein
MVGRKQPTLDEAHLLMMVVVTVNGMAMRVERGGVADITGGGNALRHWASLSKL